MNLIPFRTILISTLTTAPVFMYHLPETVTRAVLLLHNTNGAKLDPNLPDYKKGKLQAIVRSEDFESGYALAKLVLDTFKVVKRHAEGNVLIHFIEPLHDPVPFPVSKGNFIEFSVNFETAYNEH